MKFRCLIMVVGVLSSCKKNMTIPQVLPEVPDFAMGPANQEKDNPPLKPEIIHTTIGSSDTLTPRIQGKWLVSCARPSIGYPFVYNREVSITGSKYLDVIAAFLSPSDCQENKPMSMKLVVSGRLALVDGTQSTAKVNLTADETSFVFYKDDSIFAFFKKINPELVLNQEKRSQKQRTTFDLMRVEGTKLCYGSLDKDKNGLSEVNRPETTDLDSCLTLTK